MKLTIKNYYDFGVLNDRLREHLADSPEAWDILRAEGNRVPGFEALDDIELWKKRNSNNPALNEHVDVISALLKEGDYKEINSYGVGCASLEYLLKKKNPSVILRCSDFADGTVNSLKSFFKEADEIRKYDMLADPWKNDGRQCLYLFYRIDTVFDDDQWRSIFRNMHAEKIVHILFVPCEILSFKRYLQETARFLMYKLFHRKITFTGYLRTESRFHNLFEPYYRMTRSIRIGTLKGFLLTIAPAP